MLVRTAPIDKELVLFRSVVCVFLAACFGVSLCAGAGPTSPRGSNARGQCRHSDDLDAASGARQHINAFAFVNGIYDAVDSGPDSRANWGLHLKAAVSLPTTTSPPEPFDSAITGITARNDPQYPKGTDQSLEFLFRKLLTRRWTFSLQENAGIYPLGTPFLQPGVTTQSGGVQTTPFASKTKFSGTRHPSRPAKPAASYEFTGTFTVLRYNSPVSYGDQNIGGPAASCTGLIEIPLSAAPINTAVFFIKTTPALPARTRAT